jgi:hypothetical protein
VLTSGSINARRSVHYVTGYLVYDTFDQLQNIVESVFPNEVEEYAGRFEVLAAWLKYSHATSANSDQCPRHDIPFGLSPPVRNGAGRNVCCQECTSVHKLFSSLLGRLPLFILLFVNCKLVER